jgi:hypothetical protein
MPKSGGRTHELPDGSVGVLVPVPYVEVICTLTRAALAGDVSAARELRNWKEQHPEVNEHVELEVQPSVVRDRLLRRLLDELGEEEQQGDGLQAPITNTASPPTASPSTESPGGEATPPRVGVPDPGVAEAH